ncbi:MAG: toxin-antitoxin system HicB family antitoxin [Deltaproteobacteria bacterium]|nr:toxin-antitoxin system HicB family antitoxin [Deltaproteobacteria bacterium]
MKERDNYLKLVEWSEDDQCYIGSIPSWLGACCHGDEEEAVYHELCQILDEWIEIYHKDGKKLPAATANKKFSGKFQLRAGSELHQILTIRAMQAGDSLNSYCVKVLRTVASSGELR